MTYVLFDIGGAKTKITTSEDQITFGKVIQFPTPPTFEEGMSTIIESVNEIKGKSKIKGLAGGVRGLLNEDKTEIDNDTILKAWAKKPLTEKLSKQFKAPVYLENDTALAGLGEATQGAGESTDIVAYHSISSGVGGVRIEHGIIDEASTGFQPGHQVLDIDRTILGDEISPTLENLISGTGVETRLGTNPIDIPQSDVIWDELAEYLAQGLRNTILYWSPDVIVLGGSMILGDPKIEIEKIRKYTVEVLDGFTASPFITTGSLKDEACLYGAMTMMKNESEG